LAQEAAVHRKHPFEIHEKTLRIGLTPALALDTIPLILFWDA
jgi:hypothetical protein